ncbi:MAG: NACHT domain-containing protein, partial [Pseudonocardia sp.]
MFSPPVLDAGLLQAYLQAVVACYRVLDLAALSPEAQDEQVPVLLRQVFVAQQVRADPPPVELPRDLRRRLLEEGDLGPDELPPDLDLEKLVAARQAHRDQPARPVWEAVLDPARRLVAVLGDPGAGKSSLLRYLAVNLAALDPAPELAGWAGWLPVLVELRSYADPAWRRGRWADATLLDFIDHRAHEGLGLPRDDLEFHLRRGGRAVVMFDGLDELFNTHDRDAVGRKIATFAVTYPQVRVIVTSRIIGYHRAVLDGAGFALHTLQDLDNAQIEQFVHRWYAIAYQGKPGEAGRRATQLLVALERSSSARDLAGNPMLLTILAVLGRRRELPRERHRVYQHAVEVLVQHWDATRAIRDTRIPAGVLAAVDEEDKRELLRRVARRMQDGRGGIGGNHIHRDDLLAEFRTYLVERYQLAPEVAKTASKAMLEQFRDRNFILARFGPELYGFVHRALLEYCCADEIVYRLKESQEITTDRLAVEVFGAHAADPVWREVLLLIAGMIHDRSLATVIDHLLVLADTPAARLQTGQVGRHWLLALRCLAEARAPGTLAAQASAVIDRLISLFTTAAQRLHADRFESPPEFVILDESSAVLRGVVIPVAGRERYLDWYQRIPRPTSPQLGTSGFQALAVRTATALLSTNDGVERLLRHRATTDEDPDVRRVAVQALATGWPDDQTRTLLHERATTDEDPYVRRVAVQALATGWPDDQTRTLLHERATTDDHPDVREAAVQA